jgi:excisionase family DNA binding protein
MKIPYVLTDEAAEYLGVTREKIYEYLNKGKLTKYKPVRKIYIKVSELKKLKKISASQK